jgi:hypothetical protein
VKDPNNLSKPTEWPIESRLHSIVARAQSFTWKELDKDDLTYILDSQQNLFAVGKYLVDRGQKVNKNANEKNPVASVADAADIFKNRGNLAENLNIVAKNKDGSPVSLPSAITIKGVSISDTSVIAVDDPNSPKKIIGLNPGNAVAIIVFDTPNGPKKLNINFTAFASDLSFKDVSAKASESQSVKTDLINGKYIWDSKLIQQITVKDDYDNNFINQVSTQGVNSEGLTPFLDSFGVSFKLTDVTYKSGTKEADKDTFYMTSDYKIVFTPKSGVHTSSKVNVSSFTITIDSPKNVPIVRQFKLN